MLYLEVAVAKSLIVKLALQSFNLYVEVVLTLV